MYYLYSINFPNGKRYIGITNNPKRRWSIHKAAARGNTTQCFVHRAIRKYGETCAVFQILAVGEKDYILELERKAIAGYNTRDSKFGYNIAAGGEISPVAGIGHSELSKAKMRISQKARIREPESWMKFATSRLGKPMSAEHRQKLGESASRRWAALTERRSPLTLERIEIVKQLLTEKYSRREIAESLGLSKPRTRGLVVQALLELNDAQPIITED